MVRVRVMVRFWVRVMVRVNPNPNPNQPEESHSNQSEARIPELSYEKKTITRGRALAPRAATTRTAERMAAQLF